jgi:hypothetical protein
MVGGALRRSKADRGALLDLEAQQQVITRHTVEKADSTERRPKGSVLRMLGRVPKNMRLTLDFA